MTMTSNTRRSALVCAVLVLVLGLGSGSLTEAGEGSWYASLGKPALTPPGWAFAVVWPALYLLMGTGLGLIWAAPASPLRSRALFWFAAQFVLNLVWTPIYFGLHQVALALGVILALNVAAITATIRMGAVRSLAAWLMLPYLVWIAFAAVLNFRVWQLNPAGPV